MLSGSLKLGRVLYNATDDVSHNESSGSEFVSAGYPDGLKVDIYGNIFASGENDSLQRTMVLISLY